jgi:glycosyltransferase involved in cell wall biosynthesis
MNQIENLKNKKILLVITRGIVGGAPTSVLNLAREFNKMGYGVVVAFGDGEFLSTELEKEGIEYIRFKNLRRTHNPIINLKFVFEIKKFAKENNFDVVHFNSSNALLGALGVKLANKNIKTVFTFRGLSFLDEHCEGVLKWKIVRFFYLTVFRFYLIFIDEKVLLNQMNLNYAKKIGLVKNGKIVFNGLDPNKLNFYENAQACEKLSEILQKKFKISVSEKFIIGSVARLAYPKNFEFVINNFEEILKINPKAIFVIIGDGPDREKLQNLIEEKKLEQNIFLIGEISLAYKYLKSFDLFILPSIYEGMSIVVLEALFAGLPMLLSDVGNNIDLVADSEKQIYELDNSFEFLEKFKNLIENSELLIKLGQENQEKSQNFTIENTAKNYLKVYFD